MKQKKFVSMALVAFLALAVACSKSPSESSDSKVTKDTSGAVQEQSMSAENHPEASAASASVCAPILTRACQKCHTLARVCQRLGNKNKRSWKRTVKRMVGHGAQISHEEQQALVDCLHAVTEDVKEVCK